MMSLVTSEGKRLRRTAGGCLAEPCGQLLLNFDSPARDAAAFQAQSVSERPD